MRKLIWKSSAFAFVPVLAGLAVKAVWGGDGWWSLAAGGAFAALAFGLFLEIIQAGLAPKGMMRFLAAVLPVFALLVIGLLGGVCMDLINRGLLRPESFVAGIIAGTLFSQFALFRSSQRLVPAGD